MEKLPQQKKTPKGPENGELIEDIGLAEEMARAEKPYRDTSFDRARANKKELDYFTSNEFREERTAELNEEFQESLAYLEGLDEPERSKYLEEIFHPLYGEGSEVSRKIDDERLNTWVNTPIEVRTTEEEKERRKEWIEGPIPTGIKKAEDVQRTYLRRVKQKPLGEEEASVEASQVRERAREEAEKLRHYRLLAADWDGQLSDVPKNKWSWEQLARFNEIRNFLKIPLDKNIKPQDYEEALEYVERLKEEKPSNFSSWLRAKLELKILELKDFVRRKGNEAKERY